MEKILNKIRTYLMNNILFVVFVIVNLINSILLRHFTIGYVFQVEPILGDLVFVLILGGLGYLIKEKNRFKYYLIFSIILSSVCLINSMYYTNYISFTSLSFLSASSQLGDVSNALVENIMKITDFVYFIGPLALIFAYMVAKKKTKSIKREKHHALNIIVIAIIISGVFVTMLTSTDISRLSKLWNRESVVLKYGIYIYQVNDAVSTIQSQITPLFGYDTAAKNFRDYYDLEAEVETNEYTDIFEGKNIITIHAESIQTWTLYETINGEEITPFLNQLATEGLFFSSFYAQDGIGTSSDAEFTLSTGILPPSSGTVFLDYYDREYVTIQNLLSDQGYYAFSMHGNKGDFWNRNLAYDTIGYDDFYYYDKDFVIDEVIGLGLSDKSFFNQTIPILENIDSEYDNFYGTMIMLTNHTPFSDITDYSDFVVDYVYQEYNEETGLYEEATLPYLEGTKIGNYIKSVNYADAAIEQFINDLDTSGILDDTVIVIYGDHDAKLANSEYEYYNNFDPETQTYLSKDDENYLDMDYYDKELNRSVPFIIWTKDSANSSLLNQEITEVMGMYDIMPTLGNMFGVYSPYAVGSDMMSVENNIVVFPSGNWLTNEMYYNSQQGEGKILIEGITISEDYIEQNTLIAESRLTVSNDIIIYDLIRATKEQEELLESEEDEEE